MLNVNFTLEQTMKTQRGLERPNSTFSLTLALDGEGWLMPPTAQEAGCAPRSLRKGAEYLAPTGIRSPDRSVRTQSLH